MASFPGSKGGHTVSRGTLKDHLKRRIIDDVIRAVQPAGRWKLLVVDHLTLRILNSCAKMSDVLEENVTLVENIERKRQPYPNMEAIYFISPTPESVTKLADDITSAKQMYAGGHVYFSGMLADRLHTQLNIAKRSNRPFVKFQREIPLDFSMFESEVFLVDPDDDDTQGQNSGSGKSTLAKADMERLGSKIASVLLTLGETQPTIHYYNPPSNPGSQSSSLPPALVGSALSRLAQTVANTLTQLVKLDSDFTSTAPPSGNKEGHARVVLLDRSADLTQCLLHDFAYQGAAVDLVTWEGGGRFSISSESSPGQVQAAPAADGPSGEDRVTVAMDDADDIWLDNKYEHIARVVPRVQKLLVQLKAEDPALLAQSGNTDNLSRALMSLPKYTELKKRLSSHISLLTAIQSAMGRRRLVEVGALEQDMVCIRPVTADKGTSSLSSLISGLGSGGAAKSWEDELRKRMIEFLEDQDGCPDIDQLRLISLYAISRSGIPAADLAKFAEIAKLLPEDVAAINNLSALGARIVREDSVATSAGGYGRVLREAKDEEDHEVDQDGTMITPLMKYQPFVRTVLEDAAKGALPPDLFPAIVISGEDDGGTVDPGSGISMTVQAQLPRRAATKKGKPGAGKGDPAKWVPEGAVTADLPDIPQAKTGFTTHLTVVKPTWATKTPRDIPAAQVAGSGTSSDADSNPSGGLVSIFGDKTRPPKVIRGSRLVVFLVGGVTMGELRCGEEVATRMAREVVFGSTHILTPASFIDSLKPAASTSSPQPLPMPQTAPQAPKPSTQHLQPGVRRSATGARMKTLSRQLGRVGGVR